MNLPAVSSLCKNSGISFRRRVATEKSKQNQRFLPSVEMTEALITQSLSSGVSVTSHCEFCLSETK